MSFPKEKRSSYLLRVAVLVLGCVLLLALSVYQSASSGASASNSQHPLGPPLGQQYTVPGDVPTVPPSLTPLSTASSTPLGSPVPCPAGFADVSPGDPDFGAITYMTCHSVIENYPCGQTGEPCNPPNNYPYYRPTNLAARGQVIKYIVLALGWTILCPSTSHFVDVQPNNPLFCYTETAYGHGMVSGYGDGTLRPNNPVTRAQLARMLVVAMGWTINTSGGPHFTDVPSTHGFYQYIETIYNHGIITGYCDATFLPDNPLSRAEIARYIYLSITAPSGVSSRIALPPGTCEPVLTATPTATGTPPTTTLTPTDTPTGTLVITPTPSRTRTATPVVTPGCGLAWRDVSSPDPYPAGEARIYSLSAVSATDIWAVGVQWVHNSSNHLTLIEHWNGTTWSVIPSPDPGAYEELDSVTAISANDAWAVGSYLTLTGSGRSTMTLHWNGSTWSVVESPSVASTRNHLLDVSAASANDIWAVGYTSVNNTQPNATLALHWNGTSWSIVPTPHPGTVGNTLTAVSAISSSDVWVVGSAEGGSPFAERSLTMHWDGNALSVVPSPNPANSLRTKLVGMAPVSSNDVWAVGSYSDSDFSYTLTMHWNGVQWSIVPSPGHQFYSGYLTDMSALSSNDVWAVGYVRTGDQFYSIFEHWDGTSWNITYPPSNTLVAGLGGVAAVSTTDVWAGGYYGYASGPDTYTRPLIYRYSDPCGTPAPVSTPTPCAMNFSDVPPESTFYTYIRYLYCAGVISGYGDSTFRPSNPTTRGQLTKIAVLARGWAVDCPAIAHFSDVPVGSVFYCFVETAYGHGIISGYSDGTFRPANNVTRGQLTKIVVIAMGWALQCPVPGHFSDVPATEPFFCFVETAFSRGIISGYSDGTFRPGNPATRGQICKIVYLAVTGP